jgi:hypothetical protein
MAGIFTHRLGVFNPAAGGAGDPDFASTVLLLGYEGSDGSTTFTDESFAARGTPTVFNQAQVDTAEFKYGAAALLLDGTGDYLNWGDHVDFEFGSAAFTLETWYRTTTLTGAHVIIAKSGSFGTRSYFLRQNGSTLEWHVSLDAGSTIVLEFAGGTLSANTWHFIAFDFDGSKYRLYLDGTMVGSSTTVRTLHANTGQFTLGALQTAGSAVAGWLDETRITKGVARYASDGGHTVPTAAFPRS